MSVSWAWAKRGSQVVVTRHDKGWPRAGKCREELFVFLGRTEVGEVAAQEKGIDVG